MTMMRRGPLGASPFHAMRTSGWFRSQQACRRNQVLDRRPHLRPAAGLAATIGIEPEALVRNACRSAPQQPALFFGRRYAWAMDIPNTRPDRIRVVEGGKGLQQLHVAACRLNRDHVGVHCRDALDDVVELAVAHMGVDLRRIADDRRRKPEAGYRPAQVAGALGGAQWQALAK